MYTHMSIQLCETGTVLVLCFIHVHVHCCNYNTTVLFLLSSREHLNLNSVKFKKQMTRQNV